MIETDKASMDFEAQDDGVVARLLVGESGVKSCRHDMSKKTV